MATILKKQSIHETIIHIQIPVDLRWEKSQQLNIEMREMSRTLDANGDGVATSPLRVVIAGLEFLSLTY